MNENVYYEELEEYIENELHEEDLEYFSLRVEESWND